MKRHKILILSFLLIVISWGELQTQQAPQTTPQNTTRDINAQELQFLKSEIENYRKFIQEEREQHQKFLESYYDKTLTLFEIIGGIIVFLISILGITSVWQIKKSVAQLFEKYTVELIANENKPLKLSIQDLKNIINRETRYLSKRIMFLCTNEDRAKLEQCELPMIYARGIKNENLLVTSQFDAISKAVQNNTVDLMLYYYNPSTDEKDLIFEELINLLINSGKKIPLIIYNFEKPGVRGQLFNDDSTLMRSYPYHLAANFPITFVNHIYTTINYFAL